MIATILVLTSLGAPLPSSISSSLPPSIAGESNYGTITEHAGGMRFAIAGHALWWAVGERRQDGSIYVLWINAEYGTAGRAVYHLDVVTGNLVGEWGWILDVEIDATGALVGRTMESTITIRRRACP